MERQAFDLLKRAESSWWYAGRAGAVGAALTHARAPHARTALDYGAGFGGMYTTLAEQADLVDACEPDAVARKDASVRGYRQIIESISDAQDGAYDLVALFDVLEHLSEDKLFLRDAQRILSSTGRVVVTVPAYQWLWGEHDTSNHHVKRYSRAALVRTFIQAGYAVEFVSYWNCALFIPAAFLRLIGRAGDAGLTPPPLVNAILKGIVHAEAWIMRFVLLPFGLSLVLVARKREEGERSRASNLWTLVRYGIVGATGGSIQVATLYVWVSLLGLERLYLAGTVIGFCLALAFTFLMQKFWTFKNQGSLHTGIQAISYTFVALLGLLINSIVLAGAKLVLEQGGRDFFHGWYLAAQLLAVVIASGANFLLNSRITFRTKAAGSSLGK